MSNILTEILEELAFKARLQAYSPGYTKLKELPIPVQDAIAKIEEHYISKADVSEAIPVKKIIAQYDDPHYRGTKDGFNECVDLVRTKLNIKEGK